MKANPNVNARGLTPFMSKILCFAIGFIGVFGGLAANAAELVKITFAGEVNQPGRHIIDASTSFMAALQQSGGVTAWGSQRHFVIIRISEKWIDGIPELTTKTQKFHIDKSKKNSSIKEIGIINGDIIYICRRRPF